MIEAHVERFMAMGTRIELHVFGSCDPQALSLGRREIERVDDALTIHRPSPTVSLNAALAARKVAAIDNPVLLAALIETRALMAQTGGLFDPTVREGETPRSWALDPVRGTIEAEGPLAFDFGGLGKGVALDAAGDALRAAGVRSALLSAGESSILTIGHHPLGEPWPIGVPHPFAPGHFLVELDLVDEALSVSATVDAAAPGRQPTLHANDGSPVTAPLTAIAIAAKGSQAEAISTALIAANPEQRQDLMASKAGRRLCFGYQGSNAIPLTAIGEFAGDA